MDIWKGSTFVCWFRYLPSLSSLKLFWVHTFPYFKIRFRCWRPWNKIFLCNIFTLNGFFLRRNLKSGRKYPSYLYYTIPLVIPLGVPPQDHLLLKYRLPTLTFIFHLIKKIWSLICLMSLPHNKNASDYPLQIYHQTWLPHHLMWAPSPILTKQNPN